MEEEKAFCLECKNEVEASQPICCESCYDMLKKDIMELLLIKKKLEDFIDKHSNTLTENNEAPNV